MWALELKEERILHAENKGEGEGGPYQSKIGIGESSNGVSQIEG